MGRRRGENTARVLRGRTNKEKKEERGGREGGRERGKEGGREGGSVEGRGVPRKLCLAGEKGRFLVVQLHLQL
jgi:hypothetical protein